MFRDRLAGDSVCYVYSKAIYAGNTIGVLAVK